MLKNNKRRLAATAAALATFVPALSSGAVWAAGPERALAGISIFAPGTEVTRKFGNPSRILVGGASPASSTGGAAGGGMPGAPGGGGFPGAGGGFPGAGGGGFPGAQGQNAGAGLLPGFSGIPTGGGFPGGESGGFPGGGFGGRGGGFPGGGGGFPGASGGFPGASGGFPGAGGGFPGAGGNAAAAPVKQPVTLIYDRPKGGTLEFTISPDKRVVQVRETGYNGAYGTGRGIKLGVSYSAVVARYGYPENTTITGSIINIDYKDTLHCGFQFLDQRLVAIIVASPD